MIGSAGSSAASRGRLASHAFSSASLREAMPGYSCLASATWAILRLPLLGRLRRRLGLPALQHRQHLLGEEPQAALGDVVRDAAEAEGDVELELADDTAPRLQFAQDAVRRAPGRRLHEAGNRALQPGLAGDLGLLSVGVVALHAGEMVAEEFVMVEVALDELAHVLPRMRLGLREVRAAHAEIGDH